MNTAEIAQVLLESPALTAAPVLQAKLGQAGYSEAIRRCWIAGEPETGLIQISSRSDRRQAMREAAASVVKTPAAPVVAPGTPGRTFFGEAGPSPITLITKEPEPTAAPAAPATPGQPAGAPGAAPNANIGDQVTVAEGGQTYSARVQAKQPDGKFKLTFGGSRPVRDVFGGNELRVVGTPTPSAAAV